MTLNPEAVRKAEEEETKKLVKRTTDDIMRAIGLKSNDHPCKKYGEHLPHPGYGDNPGCIRCGRSLTSEIY